MNTPKNIFLIEDDKDDQDFFIEALNGIPNAKLHDVASNGKEAIEKLDRAAVLPCLIFMDINMPLMNGIECLTHLSKELRTKAIPVVMLTSDTLQMQMVRELGAKAFIKKQCNSVLLRTKMEEMINLDFSKDEHIAAQTFRGAISVF